MLITDDTMGQRGLRESQQLDGMVRAGNEFMTHTTAENEIQRSGQFVRMTAVQEEEELKQRFLLLHETADIYAENGDALDSSGFYNLPVGAKTLPRTQLFASELDVLAGSDKPFKPLRVPLDMVRMPRYTLLIEEGTTSRHGIYEYGYSAITGKRRVFPQEDGTLLVVRDVIERGGRYFYGNDRDSFSRKRSTRVTRVEVVSADISKKTVSAPIFSFPVFSGLGIDATGRIFRNTGPGDGMQVVDSSYIYGLTAGACWGKNIGDFGSGVVPFGGDAGDLYAVCEPALAHTGSGRMTYKAMLAVYAADDDVHDADSAGPYRLTCKRTLPTGGAVTSKITFQSLPIPNIYLAARGITLLRTGPSTVLLRVLVHAMQSAPQSGVSAINGDVLYFWTTNNGATWTYTPVVGGFPGGQPYGAMLVKDETTVLVFGPPGSFSGSADVVVWAIRPSGFLPVGAIQANTFSSGLATGIMRSPFIAFGFGGAVYKKTETGFVKRLWMQFDPRWGYGPSNAGVLDYPSGRPLLLVSDDGGATWQRRFLPTPWSFLAGFVVSVDQTTLAVPISARRADREQGSRVTVHISRDGGDTWVATGTSGMLPKQTMTDGQIVAGDPAEEISDCWLQYNRGEMHPMLTLADKKGNAQGSNPARPWMVNANVEKPSYG